MTVQLLCLSFTAQAFVEAAPVACTLPGNGNHKHAIRHIVVVRKEKALVVRPAVIPTRPPHWQEHSKSQCFEVGVVGKG